MKKLQPFSCAQCPLKKILQKKYKFCKKVDDFRHTMCYADNIKERVMRIDCIFSMKKHIEKAVGAAFQRVSHRYA